MDDMFSCSSPHLSPVALNAQPSLTCVYDLPGLCGQLGLSPPKQTWTFVRNTSPEPLKFPGSQMPLGHLGSYISPSREEQLYPGGQQVSFTKKGSAAHRPAWSEASWGGSGLCQETWSLIDLGRSKPSTSNPRNARVFTKFTLSRYYRQLQIYH